MFLLSLNYEIKSSGLQKTRDKGLLSKIYKELLKLNNKEINNLIKNGPERLHQDVQMAHKHMKRCSTSYIIREMQIKTVMRYHYAFIRLAKIQNTDTTKLWQGCGATETLSNSWWECKKLEDSLAGF